jgi:hypothetical protein
MSMYEWLSHGSDVHKATKTGSGITLYPKDSSLEATQQFQTIARKAIEHESDGDYKIQTLHEATGFHVRLYDFLVLVTENPK